MAPDLYDFCPCGSGKKFKWCCQPIHVDIDKAFQQDANGQHEAALITMKNVVAANADNAEAWGRYAQLLFINDKAEEAEATLQKALEIHPQYPFGYLLRGMFRQHEGEITGALLLFRKAAEYYNPVAVDQLAQLYTMIANCEIKRNDPVAYRAALQIASKLLPHDQELRQILDQLSSEQVPYPRSAVQMHTFQPADATADSQRRQSWDQALTAAATGKLSDALRAFEQLTTVDETDTAAWYNLGLVRAWLGDNRQAIEALDRYVTLESDEIKAASAWALAEVLRQGQDLEDLSDYVEQSYLYQIRDTQLIVNCLQEWQNQQHLLLRQPTPEEQQAGVLLGVVLDESTQLVVSGTEGPSFPRLGAYFLLSGPVLRIWHLNTEALERVRQDLLAKAGPGLVEIQSQRRPAAFTDILTETLTFPKNALSPESARAGAQEQAQRFLEEVWLHRPLHSLGGVSPLDAAGHGTLGKKLRGVLQFLEESAALSARSLNFERLRHKLGLAAIPQTTTEPGPSAEMDFSAMNAAELAGVTPDTLTDDQLEQACQAAVKLDARDLAAHFAQQLAARPPHPDHPDRYPLFSQLIQMALTSNDAEQALSFVDEGQRSDCEHNEGRRRNDYELRRGQILVKRGDAAAAQDTFDRLIARVPTEMRYRSSAVEAMLSARQGERALSLAEQGLTQARQQQDRDAEHHFLELWNAAKKMTGG
ncbi:MAG: tetratricopeptide repeat protein [Gemmataceae bacterium]